jgi:hypothetical protein
MTIANGCVSKVYCPLNCNMQALHHVNGLLFWTLDVALKERNNLWDSKAYTKQKRIPADNALDSKQ